MKDINDLRQFLEKKYFSIITPSWVLIVMLAVFLLAYVSNDLKVMIVAVFCLCTFGLGSISERQKKITRLLLEEIEKNNQKAETK